VEYDRHLAGPTNEVVGSNTLLFDGLCPSTWNDVFLYIARRPETIRANKTKEEGTIGIQWVCGPGTPGVSVLSG
jgi:hypothetical protein